MGRRCDRCRVEYESGVDHGGKDYCMTCYNRVREEERQKRMEEERRMKQREEEFRQLEIRRKNEEYYKRMELARKIQRENLEHEMEQRKKAEAAVASKKNKKKDEEEMKKRYYYGWRPKLHRKEAEKDDWKVGIDAPKRRKPPEIPQSNKRVVIDAVTPLHTKSDEEIEAKLDEEHDIITLTLEAEKGLPISLSTGQKGIRAMFSGKNESAKKATVELVVSLLDAKKTQLGAKAEPTQCTMDTDGTAHFAVEFDLKDTVETGLLTLSAFLKENAIYVDRDPAKSNVVMLESKVKTPIDLEYRKSTAKFVEEKDGSVLLCAEFYNKGESGGTLNMKSSVGYGTEKEMLRSTLAEKVKVKGMQKKVELKFASAKKTVVDRMTFELLGMDSNGKQYKARKVVKEKIES